jgi:hypothetical protein
MPRFVIVALALIVVALALPLVLLAQAPPPTVIDIDIKPGSDVNPINLKSHGKTPVALLCSDTFDPAAVDVTTMTLGTTAVPGTHCALEDVNDDACLDLVCHFATHALGITCIDTELTLTAVLTDGTVVTGTDAITPVPCKGKKDKNP